MLSIGPSISPDVSEILVDHLDEYSPVNAWVSVGLVLIQSFLFDAKELCFLSVLF